MEKKICVKCAYENEEHFTYCKYCGALLPVVDRHSSVSPCPTADPNPDTGDDAAVSRREYHRYVGKNSDSIVSAFEKMQTSCKKTSFCTPVFFLGIFFGFYGISAWFLSRKMKKTGFALLLLGILLTFADAFLNIGLNRELFNQINLAFSGSFSALSNLSYNTLMYSSQIISVSGYVSFICSFIAGFFALYFYKNKATQDILRIKQGYTEESPIPLELLLKRAGGRQDGMVLIPIIAALLSTILAFAVTVI